MGCTEGSLEEAQLIHWATIADNWEWATGIDKHGQPAQLEEVVTA